MLTTPIQTWALNLPDTQKALGHFWDTCYEGGTLCALYKSGDKSPKAIQDRVEAFLDELDAAPAPYLGSNSVVTITKQDVLHTIFVRLYQPQREFARLATILVESMAGNFTQLYNGLGVPKSIDSCPVSKPETYTWDNDAHKAIACGDGKPQANLTIPEFLDHLKHLKSDSPYFGANWATIRLDCKGWRFRPKYSFSGPWVTPKPDSSIVEGRPAAPLLFISSRFDPVTPLANAYEMSKDHPGSGVLIQENVGHGALLSPGKCREGFISKYFETGELPPKGTVCTPDCKPFHKCPGMDVALYGLDEIPEPLSRRGPLSLF